MYFIDRMGKTTLLKHIADRKLSIPPNIDVLYCEQGNTCTCVCVYIQMYSTNTQYVYIHTIYTCTYNIYMYIQYIHVHTIYTCTYNICIYIYIYIYTYTHVYVCIYIYMYIQYMYIYIYIYIYSFHGHCTNIQYVAIHMVCHLYGMRVFWEVKASDWL